jgi:hypothetical protein
MIHTGLQVSKKIKYQIEILYIILAFVLYIKNNKYIYPVKIKKGIFDL